ncbi:MAG: alpha/beta fold hydrolase [Acidimicrobiia bacterium]
MQPAQLLHLMIGDTVPRPIVREDGRIGPAVPLGRRIDLPGRGTTFVREVAGPKDAPTLLLLHGFVASGGLNWFRTFDALGQDFRVIAPDARGHARGLRSRRHMRLADCADDMAALIDELDTGPVIAAGYSMGGPIAQLLWKRHPEKVAGLVLCATAPRFGLGASRFTESYLGAVAGLTRVTGQLAAVPAAGANALRRVRAHRPASFLEWAADEMRRHDVRMLTEGARSICRFDSLPWIGDVDVPTTVVRTNRDRLVDPESQTVLVRSIRRAKVIDHDHGHFACAHTSFSAPVVAACRDVAWRASA